MKITFKLEARFFTLIFFIAIKDNVFFMFLWKNMDTTTTSVINTFKQIMLNKVENMDTKMFNYWTNAIRNKDKNIDDFKTFLLKSQDYHTLLRNTFMDIFYEKLSDTNFYDLYENFLKYNAEREITIQDILEFITNSHYFIEKYQPIIKTIYEAVRGEDPSDDVVFTYLQKFKMIKDYDIEKLQEDIQGENSNDSIENMSTADDTEDELNNNEDDLEDMSENDKEEFILLSRNKTHLLEWYKQVKTKLSSNNQDKNINIETPHDHLDFVDLFEDIFGRNMNVREYMFYMKQFMNKDKNVIETEIQKLKKQYDEVFESVSYLLKQFLDKDLAENQFIKQYFFSIHHPEFLSKLKNTIIHSTEYAEKMKTRLSNLYEKLYDEMLTNEDKTYLFERIISKEYDLLNDQLNNEIVEYKNETDKLVERIFNIFVETYDREPDTYELQKYVSMYRTNKDNSLEEIDAFINEELRDSLEFHDVIKSKIKKLYSTMFDNKILSPSMIYNILKKVLDKKAHQKDLDETIKTYIHEL
jgi:hypothetical protein